MRAREGACVAWVVAWVVASACWKYGEEIKVGKPTIEWKCA